MIRRFNFNNDGYVTKEDIRIMLSYVPFHVHDGDDGQNNDFETKSSGSRHSRGSEGLYNSRA
jgi:hypothetical protein